MNRGERPMDKPQGPNRPMRISPEPLHPLRSWRELWQSEHAVYESGERDRPSTQTSHWKQQKRPGFQWFNHLFSHGSNK